MDDTKKNTMMLSANGWGFQIFAEFQNSEILFTFCFSSSVNLTRVPLSFSLLSSTWAQYIYCLHSLSCSHLFTVVSGIMKPSMFNLEE